MILKATKINNAIGYGFESNSDWDSKWGKLSKNQIKKG